MQGIAQIRKKMWNKGVARKEKGTGETDQKFSEVCQRASCFHHNETAVNFRVNESIFTSTTVTLNVFRGTLQDYIINWAQETFHRCSTSMKGHSGVFLCECNDFISCCDNRGRGWTGAEAGMLQLQYLHPWINIKYKVSRWQDNMNALSSVESGADTGT